MSAVTFDGRTRVRVLGFAQRSRVRVDGKPVWVMTRDELLEFAAKVAADARERVTLADLPAVRSHDCNFPDPLI